MAKTLRTSGDYTIKAGDGFNSGSGTNTINLDSLNVSITGNLTVAGTSSTISTTNTIIEDNIIELQTGISASSNDSGIIIERGSTGDNAAIIWDESVDSFKLGTTTATGADKSGGITVTAGALGIGALTATTGTFSGAVTSVGHTVEGNITAGSVTTNEIGGNGSNAAITVTSSGTGDITLDAGGDIILDADNADIKLKDGGIEFGRISRVTSDLVIKSMGDNNDIILKGLDDSATINALTLDMSAAGAATFNSTVTATDITANSLTTNVISSNGSNADLNISASGTGDVLVSALRVNGTTIDSSDSSAVQINENTEVDGTLTVTGNVGIGTATPEEKFHVLDTGSSQAAKIHSDTNNSGVLGMSILAGLDTASSSGDCKWVRLADGNDSGKAYIQFKSSSPNAEFAAISDERLKTNIQNTDVVGLDVINNLRLVKFDWNDTAVQDAGWSMTGHQKLGFVAQEVEAIVPEFISEDANGFKIMGDSGFIPYLIKAVQEQQTKIQELEARAIHTFTGTDAVTETEHAGRTLLLGEVGGNANVVLTLPDATGSGNIYHFIVSVAMGGSTTYKIQVPDADNTITGQIMYLDEDGTAVTSFPTVAASDTITLNSGTQGGLVGDTLTLIDIAADKYAVSGNMRVAAGANPATPFSEAVS